MKTPNPKFKAALAVTLLSCASFYSGCRLRHEIAREGVGLRTVAEQITLETLSGEFDAISIQTSIGEPHVTTVKNGPTTLSATLLGESKRTIEYFVYKHLKRDIQGRTLHLEFAPMAFSCERSQETCVEALAIQIPEDSRTKIFLNGIRVDRSSPLTLSDALFGMRTIHFGPDRLKVFEAYMSTIGARERFARVADIKAVIELVSFSVNKLRVAELCSGRLIDPENADVLGELFVFEDDREQAVRLLKM